MPLIPFPQISDQARLWTFPAARRLSDDEATRLLAATDEFLAGWTAHEVPLATAREWRHDQFLFVGVDEAAAGASGCSIDALVRFVRDIEPKLGVTLTDNAPVWFRDAAGAIASVSRGAFQRLVDQGQVGLDSLVFDHTIQTVGALREGRWEVPARRSWHAQAFFADSPAPVK